MKKLFTLFLAICILMIPILSLSESFDLSGLSLADLVKLQERVTMAMWKTEEWQEVTVPAGLYKVGVEIPVGKWTITATPKASMAQVEIGNKLDDTGMGLSWAGSYESNYLYGKESWSYNESKMNSWDVTLSDGLYIKLAATMIFTPYSGPSFSFK